MALLTLVSSSSSSASSAAAAASSSSSFLSFSLFFSSNTAGYACLLSTTSKRTLCFDYGKRSIHSFQRNRSWIALTTLNNEYKNKKTFLFKENLFIQKYIARRQLYGSRQRHIHLSTNIKDIQQTSPKTSTTSTTSTTTINNNNGNETKQLTHENNTQQQKLAMRIWEKVKTEAKHYWHGSKLLVAETKISWTLFKQVLHGHELTRRERRQLQRTVSDLLRLIPFAVIVVIPFAELALPILLKLFPNLLPSTFADTKTEQEKIKKQLALKVEMARFLQQTTALMTADLLAAKGISDAHRVTVAEFQNFINRVRSGHKTNAEEITKYAALFNEDFTLENLNRLQLEAMCRLLDIRTFGSDAVLRYKLQSRLRALKRDDKVIDSEGVDSLDDYELNEACRARGISSVREDEYKRRKLAEWIKLSIHSDVPIPLLVLSRAFSKTLSGRRTVTVEESPSHAMPEIAAAMEAEALHPVTSNEEEELTADIATTLGHLPETVVHDTEQEVVSRSSSLDDAEKKLQQLRDELKRAKEEAARRKETVRSISAPIDLKVQRDLVDELKQM